VRITPQQAEALGRFLLTIRPDWSKHYTVEAVREMRHISDDLEAIVAAAVRGALSPKIAKPDVLAMNGEHWKPPTRGSRGPATLITGRCADCGRLHVPAEPCPPPQQESQQAAAHRATEARALLASSRTDLCPCGVKPRDCADHRPEAQPKEMP
jgi:hypothetical protein